MPETANYCDICPSSEILDVDCLKFIRNGICKLYLSEPTEVAINTRPRTGYDPIIGSRLVKNVEVNPGYL